jgi:hypothetical protein
MQPSDFPEASAAALVPLAFGLPRGERFFCTGRTCVRLRAARRRLRVRGLRGPARTRGPSGISQVTGSSVAAAPWSFTPPGASPHRPVPVTTAAAFRRGKSLGTRDKQVFGAAFPTAQRLACLRINRVVATPIARRATGLPGSALAGRDWHPLDGKPNLRKSSQDFLLLDQHCLVALPRTCSGVAHAVLAPPARVPPRSKSGAPRK